ncbi:ATP-binding cassette domain-containing protein [Streptomyces sp. NBC_01476]|uniref:ATP-binding cassette domain-containing protein n=1 Tax=Streptomyces sp. NBC_01476 TaxID=2903881 RepID=UPI002E30CBBA|nr:ATP-binding cassette domain-containing protein [Streptomyces sp. NBC_01476]
MTLTVARGDFLALTGPSGAGKSTLLHLLGGLHRPDSGRLHVAGRRMDLAREACWAVGRCRRFGIVFQTGNLLGYFTVAGNVELSAILTAPGAVAVPLRVVGIADARDQVSYERAGYGLGWVGPAPSTTCSPSPSTAAVPWVPPLRPGDRRLRGPAGSRRHRQRPGGTPGHTEGGQGLTAAGRPPRGTAAVSLSGLGALLGASLAVAGAAGARTRARQGDMALLKALGFARSQIVAMFLLEHLLLAGGGSVLGALCAALSAPAFCPSAVAGVLDPGVTTAVTAAAIAVISLAAALPSYRAGRSAAVPPAADADTDTEPPARLLWSLRRLPAAAVLGLTGVLRRPRTASPTPGAYRWSAIGLLALLAVILTTELLSVTGTMVRERRSQLGVFADDRKDAAPGGLGADGAEHGRRPRGRCSGAVGRAAVGLPAHQRGGPQRGRRLGHRAPARDVDPDSARARGGTRHVPLPASHHPPRANDAAVPPLICPADPPGR